MAADVASVTPGTSSRAARVASGTAAGIAHQLLTIGLQIILVPVVVTYAGGAAMGAYAVLSQLVAWGSVTSLGLGVAAGRTMAQAYGSDEGPHALARVLRSARSVYWLTNAAFAMFVAAATVLVPALMVLDPDPLRHAALGTQLRTAGGLYAVWVFVRTPLALYGDALVACQDVAVATLTAALGTVIRLVASIGLVWLGAGVIGLAVAALCSEVVVAVINAAMFRRLHWDVVCSPCQADSDVMRGMLRFGMAYLITIVSQQLANNTSGLVIGVLFGAVAVTMSYASQMPATVLGQMVWKITDSAAPAINQLHAHGDRDSLTRAYLRLLRFSLACGGPLAIGVVVFARTTVALWVGEEQYVGGAFTIAVAVTMLLEIVIHLHAMVFIAYGSVRALGVMTLVASIARVLLWLGCGRMVGLSGLMVIAAAINVVLASLMTAEVHRLLGLRHRRALGEACAGPVLVGACCSAVAVLIAPLLASSGTWAALLGCSATYLLAWMVPMWAFGLNSADRRLAVGMLQRWCGRWLPRSKGSAA